MNKQEILEEIKRTATQNGGNPLGMNRFEKETGIKPHEWGKYWARFSQAQTEAGFTPNRLQTAYSDEFLIKKAIELTSKLGKFPTFKEFRVAENTDEGFPSSKVFMRFGSKEELVRRVVKFCKTEGGNEDIIGLCQSILEKHDKRADTTEGNLNERLGSVYLFKSGRYYKIGKTFDTVRRGNEIRIQLPERLDLIHSINTDDPSGVEAYWHRRFDGKRMNGEWFDLSTADIKSFRRWKRIY
ncbi:GIY-YIG nuclease family protein [Patescibacteria group bacterium]|nr:MAG: GIY-YIG nuclease family protein [Patescibacteria group bacterium]